MKISKIRKCFEKNFRKKVRIFFFEINFRHEKLIFFVQIFFLARYGWLLSIPHVYTASFWPCDDGAKENRPDPLNPELPGSFRKRLHMNCSPKISRKLVVFELKMVPLVFGTVLGVAEVRIREPWFILLCRRKPGSKIFIFHGEIVIFRWAR